MIIYGQRYPQRRLINIKTKLPSNVLKQPASTNRRQPDLNPTLLPISQVHEILGV